MKKLVALLLAFGLVFTMVAPAYAQEDNPMTKIGRGLLNILDGVVEIPGTMMRDGQENGAGSAFTKGLFEGIVNTVKREVVGAYEVVTFPFPIPADYSPILDDPQFLETS